MSDRVHVLGPDDLDWSFGDSKARYRLTTSHGRGGHHSIVDPFPCYTHEQTLVRATLERVEAAAPLPHQPEVFVLSHEPFERTNGWAQPVHAYDYDTEEWKLVGGIIVLAGKRIPPHPGVTRYLVAHEYGHHADYAVCAARGVPTHEDLDAEYAELRGCPERAGLPYSGGTWHADVGELIANDFRILVAGIEPEFWPHPGFAHPEEAGLRKRLLGWWKEHLP